MRGRRAAAVAVLLAGCAGALPGCSVVPESFAGNRPVQAATTTNFITDTVRQVGGDRVEVVGLMGPGVDPHLYKASARDVRTLRDADVIFYGGLQLEGKMGEVFAETSEEQPTVALSDGMPRDLLLAPPSGAPAKENYDPHVWFDVSLWTHAVRSVRDGLIEADPDGESQYRANADRYLERLRRLHEWAGRQIARIPERQRLLVTSHDAFAYFGRAYDIDVEAIQGISTATEATTSDIDRIARLLAERDVGAVFVESSVPRQTVDAVLEAAADRGHEAVVGAELYADAAGDEGTPEGTYEGMVRANVIEIVEGLAP
jgi:manganese/zinc/iron transport system substrate-binding protein